MQSSVRPMSVARKSLSRARGPEQAPPSSVDEHDSGDKIDKNAAGDDVQVIHLPHSSAPTEPQLKGQHEVDVQSVSNQSAVQVSNNQSDPSPPPHSPSPSHSHSPPLPSVPPPKPDRAWVRHLISSRRRVRTEGPLDNWHSDVSTNSDEAWLRTQHAALASGSLSMTMKCVLAAAEITTAFSAHAAAFQKPEYRTRYWTWCTSFIKLVDVVLDHHNSDPNVDLTPSDCPQDISDFVRNMREQRAEGLLPQPREALLSALGVRWTAPPQSHLRSNDVIPTDKRSHAGDKETDGRESQSSERSKEPEKKRRRSENTNGTFGWEQQSGDGGTSSRQSMKKWASEFVKLRTYFRSHGAQQGGYEIPVEAADVKIWRNAEIARISTGASSIYCFTVLKCADLIDKSINHSYKPGSELSYWCLLYVRFVDAVIEKRAHSSQNTRTFLARCCTTDLAGKLPSPLQGLLEGVFPSWRKMGLSALGPEESRPSVTFADVSEPPIEVPRTPTLSHPIEREMVMTMIKGLVAECVAGENKTSEQRQAEEWVAKAGADALNRYARTWIQRVGSG